MRTLAVTAALLAACGGGDGRCELPPCEVPPHRCTTDADCFQTELCDFQNNSCGALSADEGFCAPRPYREACEFESLDLVCGCDGVYHDNACSARFAGTDEDALGDCALPPNAFACGSKACVRGEQFCIELPRDDVSSTFSCERIPDACRITETCACLRMFGCEDCTDSDGELRMKCDFPDPVPTSETTSSGAAPRASTSAWR